MAKDGAENILVGSRAVQHLWAKEFAQAKSVEPLQKLSSFGWLLSEQQQADLAAKIMDLAKTKTLVGKAPLDEKKRKNKKEEKADSKAVALGFFV